MIAVGSVIGGRYRIDQIVGAGGMGIVAAATHLELGHRVAIKFLRDEMAADPTIVDRFIREARSVVNLRTEHVCRVFDVGRLETNAPYMVMEMLDGADLARAIAKQPLPVTTAVEYVMQACVALAEAHAAGVIHRDLKPANLFVTRRLDGGPLVKVLDFGIAKALTETDARLTHNTAMGSPGYMSPEQLQSARDVDTRTDIWALGVTLYQLLSARMPFAAANMIEVGVRIASDAPDPLDVDPALRDVVFRCLEKSPDARYPDVAALVAALVPFGGPAARRIAATVGQLANKSIAIAPAPPPVVAASAPTAASFVAAPAHAVSQGPARAPSQAPVAPATSHRWRWLVLVGVVLAGGAVAIVVAAREPDHAVVANPSDARPIVAVAPADAPIVAVVQVDAEIIQTVAIDAASPVHDPWATPGRDPWATPPDPSIPPHDARTIDEPPHDAGRPHNVRTPEEIAEQLKHMPDYLTQECKAMVDPHTIDNMPLSSVIMCWCRLHDRARAVEAYARLSSDAARKQARAECAAAGVKLD